MPTISCPQSADLIPKEHQLQLALSAADLGFWSLNPATDLVSLSPSAAELFRVSPAGEVRWSNVCQRIHPDDLNKTAAALQDALETGEKFQAKFRLLGAAGELHWLSAKGRALIEADGCPSALVGVVCDITESKLAEANRARLAVALQDRLVEWQSLFDTAPIAIWLAHDPLCKVVTGNHYTNAILGVPNGTNISLTSERSDRVSFEIWQDGHPITREEIPLRIASFKGIPVRNCEQEVKTPDGRSVTVLVNAVPLYNEKGEIRGALATGLDITERKKAESALRESEERFRLMADASPALIWMGGPDKLCTWTNKAWLSFVGKSLHSQLGDGWLENVHPEDLPECLRQYLVAFETRQEFEAEYRLRRHDGSYRWLLNKARPLFGPRREFAGFIGSCVDVTDSKVRRDELEALVTERTVQMKESIAHLEAFSYTVSHDMRAPLRSMEGFSKALLDDYGDRLDATGKDYLQRVIRSAQKLDLLIGHVLSYSRIATGRMPLQRTNLHHVLSEVIHEHVQLSPENADIHVQFQAPSANANEAMLGQIFTNLLLNATKFVKPGIKPCIRVGSEPSGGMIKVSVEDNGIGIAPEHQSQIFDIFTRLHAENEYGGTGIGLAIVKKAVQMLGGEVGLESRSGGGSLFWFTIKA